MAWDFRKEEDVKKYLENLNIEYKFGCYQEKKPNVCHLLGDFYEAVKQEFTAAYDVYKTNCETNKFAPSCNKYATYLIRGKECEKDWDKAGELMIQSCNEGFQPSCYFAGLFSLNGTSRIPKNVQLGLESLDKCCIAGGNADCCFALASVYLKGSEDVQKDMLKAAKYSQACCDLRLPQGCANLSRMYRLGDGVEKNEVKAAEYSKLAKEIIEELRNPIDLGLTG